MFCSLSFLAAALSATALAQNVLRDADASLDAERQIPFVVNAFTQPSVNKVIPIIVGGSSLTYTPNSVQADIGDVLQFQFAARNHTVTQSTEDNPCQPMLESASANATIHSGFIAFSNSSQSVGTFNVVVRSNDTMFLYCAQARHCQQGMVMAVNADSSQQLIAYANRAAEMNANVPARFVSGGVTGVLSFAQAAFPVNGPAGGSTTTSSARRDATPPPRVV